MKKVIKIILWSFLGIIFLGTIVFLASKSMSKESTYELHSAYYGDIEVKTVAAGSVQPRKEVLIKSQISGIVEEIYFEAGEIVKEGDIIAKITVIPDMINLSSAESRVSQAQLNAQNATVKYDRQKELYEKSVISLVEFQNEELAYQLAQEELQAAINSLYIIKDGVSQSASTATNTLIRSTISGVILDIPIKEGNSVIQSNNFNDGTTIASVADMNDMIFIGKVDETEVGKLSEGMSLQLTIGAIQDEEFEAVLEYVSPKGVTENGAVQFEIKAKVELKEGQFIRAGYSANANIVQEKKDSILIIPETYISFSGDTSFVEILVNNDEKNQEFEKREIETGISDGINIEVISGLSTDDKVKGNLIMGIKQ